MTEQPAFDLTPEPSKPNRLPTIESSDAGPGKQLTSLNNPETRLKLAESEPAGAFWAFCLLVILISVAAAFLSRKPIHLPPSDEIVAALVGWRPGDGVLRSKLQLAVEGAVDWTEAGLVWLHVAVIQPHWGRFTPEEQVPWSYDVFAGGGPLHWGTMVNVSSGQVMYPTCDSTRADSRQSPVAIVDDGGNADGAVQVVDGDAGLIRSCAVTKWTVRQQGSYACALGRSKVASSAAKRHHQPVSPAHSDSWFTSHLCRSPTGPHQAASLASRSVRKRDRRRGYWTACSTSCSSSITTCQANTP